MDYYPSKRHGQFTATPKHEELHDKYCPCMKEDELSELVTINNYMREAAALLKAKKANTKEFELLIKKINNESLLLTPVQRSLVLDRFFAIWDRKN